MALGSTACSKKANDGHAPTPAPGKPAPTTAAPDVGAPAPTPVPPTAAPSPTPDQLKGKTRMVNLLLDACAKTQKVDLWSKRGVDVGPMKLAEGVDYGQASTWFGVPAHAATAIVAAGGASDGPELAGLRTADPGHAATALLFLDDTGKPTTTTLFDAGETETPKPPAAGKGLVVMFAWALSGHEKELDADVGHAFYVGDGKGTCLKSRLEAGTPDSMELQLGGTMLLDYELPPGATKLTLHRQSGDHCKSAPVLEIAVDVQADKGTWVLIGTPDGKKVDALTLPFGTP